MKPIRLTVLAAVALVAPLAFAQGAKLKVGLMLPATGEAVAKRGHKKIVTVTWKYAAGDEMVVGFKEAFEKAGGQVVKELNLPFPNVEFQALLTDVAATKPDGVFAFFAGGGAVKFVKDYTAAGLKKTIPLYGNGFLTGRL